MPRHAPTVARAEIAEAVGAGFAADVFVIDPGVVDAGADIRLECRLGVTVIAPARTMMSPAVWAWASGAASARATREALSKDLFMRAPKGIEI
ncbi:hypothetical protein D3C76_1430540 [compost metagenome]